MDLGNVIEEIRERNDIVEVISEYMALKKAGKNFKALCPFHAEKTPSFMVSPEKQLWHCFGCGRGGNVFTFLMNLENMTFSEAARKLANRVGLKFEYSKEFAEQASEREKLCRVNLLAANYYHRLLTQSEAGRVALDYLVGRGLDLKVIKKFALGYSLPIWDGLLKFAKAKGIAEVVLERAGLAVAREDGSGYYDRFRGRIMFPIWDTSDRVVGFGGRVLVESEDSPKYLNSPETAAFNKGKTLYGLNYARRKIGELDYVVVVEGYMDAITAHQYGFEQTVATLGTALTGGHLRLIGRFTSNLVLAYDADSAGMGAVLRSSEIFEQADVEARVAILPGGSDPDGFIRGCGGAEFQKLLDESMPLIDYKLGLIRQKHDLSVAEGKVKMLHEFIPVLAEIKNSIKRREYVRRVAGEYGYPEQMLVDSVERVRKKASAGGADFITETTSRFVVSGSYRVEAELLKLMLKDEKVLKLVRDELGLSEFVVPVHREIVKVLYELYDKGEVLESSAVVNALGDEQAISVVTEFLMQPSEIANEGVVKDYIKHIKDYWLRNRLKELGGEVKELLQAGRLSPSDERYLEYQKLVHYFRGVNT